MGIIFRQIRNDANDIKAIADGYRTKIGHPLWLADGLQKDAIQNSWDARVDKKHGKGWECGFSLLDIGGEEILCIEDWGTTGLNGAKFYTEEELSKILNKNKSGEDLAYFLNSNWSAKSSEEGGNRGRGKTLFLIASKEKRIFFDSLRSTDDTYICGELYLDNDKQIKFKLSYDQDAQKIFAGLTKNKISILDHYGTRIFIVNPESTIIDAIKNGEIVSFINYCRWETIKKHQAKIFIKNGDGKRYAVLPKWYEDKTDFLSKEFPLEKIKENTSYRIKKLVLRYAPNSDVPEIIKGISIQRGLMSIQCLRADELVHEEGMNDIYGWVEMDEVLEKDMKNMCEGPEHVDFAWTAKPAKYLKDYIRIKIREFAKELKIIESEEARKNKIQKTAEENALKSLSPFFKKLGLIGKHKGTHPKKPHKRKGDEPLRLSISDIIFPEGDSRRVDYGEKIVNTYVVPINELSDSVLVLVRVFIVSDEGKTEVIEEKEINLRPGRGSKIGTDEIIINSNFNKGGYSLRGRMISLEKKNWKLSDGTSIEKGTILYDRINQKFYVEVDPPESGPFRFQPEKKENKEKLFRWEPEGDNGYVIFYNELHPLIKIILDDVEKLDDYLTEQGALIALQIRLEELITEEEDRKDIDFIKLINSEDVSNVWPVFLKKYSEFMWDLKEQNGNKNKKKE